MFGSRKSANDKFVMMKGREVGNIKKVTSPAKAGMGKQHVAHTNFGHAKGVHGAIKVKGAEGVGKGNGKALGMTPASKTFSGVLRKSKGKMEDC